MSELRILLYGDIDLNFMDGSAVWLTSIAPVLSLNPHVHVDLLLKAEEKNDYLTQALKTKNNLQLIQPFQDFRAMIPVPEKKAARISVNTATQIMSQLHAKKRYHLIIVRGFNLVREIMKYDEFQAITVPYLTDFKHDHRSTAKERADLKSVYEYFDYLFLQTKETKAAFQKLIKVDGAKIRLLYPMVPEVKTLPSFQNKHSRLIYSGKFHEDWHTEEIISVAKKLAKQDPRIKVQIVGDKFQDRLRERGNQLRIKKELQETTAIDWVGAVSRSDCQTLIAEADVGISWRSAELDNDDSVELSSKLLEYGRLGKPALVRRTKMHEDLLGKDYPLFVNSEADVIAKTIAVLEDDVLYRSTAEKIYSASQEFTFHAAYNRLKDFIWSFAKTKIKIVFAGHDLKFARLLIEYFESHSDFEVRLDQFETHEKHNIKHSKACLEWADVIFCEWGLGNVVWYSKHKKPQQTLLIRMHFQEKDLILPQKIDYENVDKIIVITPYMLEEFHRIFRIPRAKMVYLDNLIDAEKLALPKTENYLFHLGICGILPARKRLDLAIDLFEKLWQQDRRYRLFIKGKLPEELPWLMAREKERIYYDDLFKRIRNAPWQEAVIFDAHGNDVHKWLQKIGYLLSPSDYEGSHVAVSEAMASGTVPVIWNWQGANTIYPPAYIVGCLQDAKRLVKNKQIAKQSATRMAFAARKFDRKSISQQMEALIRTEIKKINEGETDEKKIEKES